MSSPCSCDSKGFAQALIRHILWRMRRAPTLLVALCAALVELIVLAAAGNQWVYDRLVKHESTNELVRTQRLKATLTSFAWRFTPEQHQRMLWLGEVVAVVGLIIVVFLLVLAFVAPIRGQRSFVTVFLGTWGIVFGLTQLAAIGRTMIAYGDVLHRKDPDNLGRWWYAAFDGPTAETVLFGLVSGLLVGIVAGIVAVITSRGFDEADEPGMPMPGDEGPAWSAALGSTQAMGPMGEPERSWAPREPEPPPWPQPWSPPPREPEAERRGEWGNVTESTGVTQALPPEAVPPPEPTTEITRPRQPPADLPGRPPGSTGRLPLPEEAQPRGMGR
jgi:hypothetical protein